MPIRSEDHNDSTVDRATRVKAMQTKLNAAGAKLQVDGVFGPATMKAMIDISADQLKAASSGIPSVALDVRANLLVGAPSSGDVQGLPIKDATNMNLWLEELPLVWSLKGRKYIQSAVWQVANLPFPSDQKNWKSPPGLIASGSLDKIPEELTPWEDLTSSDTRSVNGTSWASFSLDIEEIIKPPDNDTKLVRIANSGTSSASHDPVQPQTPGVLPGGRPAPVKVTPSPILPGWHPNPVPATTPSTPAHARIGWLDQSAVETASANSLDLFQQVKTSPTVEASSAIVLLRSNGVIKTFFQQYYLRLALLNAQGQCVGFSKQVTLDTKPVPKPKLPQPPKPLPVRYIAHPSVRIVRVVPWWPNRWYNQMIWTGPDLPFGAGLHYGDRFILNSGDQDAGDYIADAINSVVDAFEWLGKLVMDAVNWVSRKYEELKAAAVNVVADAIQCCSDILMSALNIGLAAMGLPPHIPNFDQLVSGGQDYLVGYMADQLPADIPYKKELLNQAINGLASQARATYLSGGGTGVWMVPDPDYLERPAQLTLNISNPGATATDAVHLEISGSGLFTRPPALPMPSLAPGATMTVPVCMQRYVVEPPYGASGTAIAWSKEEYWSHRYIEQGERWSVSTVGDDVPGYAMRDGFKEQDAYQGPPDQDWSAA